MLLQLDGQALVYGIREKGGPEATRGPNILPDIRIEARDGLAGVYVDELFLKVDGNTRLGLSDIVADELALDV